MSTNYLIFTKQDMNGRWRWLRRQGAGYVGHSGFAAETTAIESAKALDPISTTGPLVHHAAANNWFTFDAFGAPKLGAGVRTTGDAPL